MDRKRRVHALRLLAVFLLACGMVSLSAELRAQTAPSSGQQNPAQQPGQEAGQPPQQSPEQQASNPQAQQPGVQTFTGVVVKSGEKYVLQDDSTGTMYDMDHQDQVKQFEGKKVRVHGTLDSNGKLIHVL